MTRCDAARLCGPTLCALRAARGHNAARRSGVGDRMHLSEFSHMHKSASRHSRTALMRACAPFILLGTLRRTYLVQCQAAERIAAP